MKIYEPAGRAREYSPLALNYFKGCDHGCKYCYVQPMMKRFNANYDHSVVSCDLNLRELEKSILSLSKEDRKKQILLSFTGDPYCNFETDQTKQVLEVLLKHQLHVAILTKNPHKALKDIDLFRQFEHFKIGTTLVVADEAKRQEWEPGTIHSSKRIEALERFQSEGIITWASFEPVIYPDQSLAMLKDVASFIDHVKVGKLNNYKGLDSNIDWGKFLFDAVFMMRSYGLKFYIKNDLAKYNKGVYLSGDEINEDFLNI
ncbi:MAG TPA: radical SAM protein [Chryseolinea sp.]|nr:radical SAM protein [Chryseolinea sp.]